jgi:Mitochondrial ribosomal subunit S27
MIEYYPNQLSIASLNKEFPGLDLVDEYEAQRLQDVVDKKKRGKGAPKKAKSAGTLIVYIVSLVEAHYLFSNLIADSRRAQRKR